MKTKMISPVDLAVSLERLAQLTDCCRCSADARRISSSTPSRIASSQPVPSHSRHIAVDVVASSGSRPPTGITSVFDGRLHIGND